MFSRIALASAAACLFASGAQALDPVVSGTRGAQIAAVGPIGESFVADTGQLTSFGFQFAVANNVAVAPVLFELRAGAGLAGTLVTSTSASPVIPIGRTPTWYDFALTGVALTVGQTYTALVSTSSTRLALIFGPTLGSTGMPLTGDAYPGGSLVSASPVDTVAGNAGFCSTSMICDANFRLNASTTAVPEPAAWLTLTIGFVVTGAIMRRARALSLSRRAS